jgi:hypothetical protein
MKNILRVAEGIASGFEPVSLLSLSRFQPKAFWWDTVFRA